MALAVNANPNPRSRATYRPGLATYIQPSETIMYVERAEHVWCPTRQILRQSGRITMKLFVADPNPSEAALREQLQAHALPLVVRRAQWVIFIAGVITV